MIVEMRRPLPSFLKWLDDHGHDVRGEGFEALADLARRTQEQHPENMTDDEASFLRMWQGLSIAVVELCNLEFEHGRSPHQIIGTMPRALAAAAFYSTASVLKEHAPWRAIAKVLTEEFRHGAKVSADQYLGILERAATVKMKSE